MAKMDGTQIYNNFQGGEPQILQAWADAIADLSNGYTSEAQAIVDLQNRMSQSWTGASGDAAYAGAGPLEEAFRVSSVPLDQTTNAMNTQTATLSTAKSTVVPVPPAPEKPSGWSIGLKAAIPIVGPSMAAGEVNSYEDGMNKHNAANETNVRVMDQYSSATDSTKSTIPQSYQTLNLDGASVSLSPAKLNVVRTEIPSTYNDTTHASSSTGYQSVGSPMGGGPVSAPPNLNGPSSVSASAPPAGGAPGNASGVPNIPAASSGPAAGGTGSSGFLPGVAGGYGGSSGDTEKPGSGYRAGTGSGGPGAAGRNSAASRLYGSESEGGGRGASGESVGRGGSAAGESARGLGSGKSTGAGNLGSAAATEEAAAGRSAAKGAGGAPMGGAGQRGRGAEDDEHQRPDYLLEADPDSIFGTDVRTTPPVLGE